MSNENKMTKANDEEVKALANEHGKENLRLIDVPKNEDETEFIQVVAKIPTRNVTSQYSKWADTNPKKAQEILVRGCILTNQSVIMGDDFMFNTTVAALAELIPIGTARIKKL